MERITDLDMTPSQAETLVEELRRGREPGRSLRLWVGGESISVRLWESLAGDADGQIDAVNVYGVTEATVDTTWTRVESGVAPNIGQPLPGSQVLVLDAMMRVVPAGVEGELYIGGPSLARGYLGRAGLTAQRFVPNPFASQNGQGARLYRTGDRVRWNGAGQLEFLGRTDHQVKIRGYRIELTEIESVLCGAPGVVECAVVRREDDRGVALWAFVRGDVDVEQVRAHAEAALPAWMCPSGYSIVAAMPKTPSGKLDRETMSKAEVVAARAAPAALHARPMNAIERAVSTIWSEILQVEAVRPGDNFFHLGGHSLLAIKMIARIKRSMQLTLSMTAIFEKPVLSEFAALLERLIREQLAARTTSAASAQ
jgi:acyl-coenzyme A synthetase/AMP-(fatty) acid ligase